MKAVVLGRQSIGIIVAPLAALTKPRPA